jgi:hypothetical protein
VVKSLSEEEHDSGSAARWRCARREMWCCGGVRGRGAAAAVARGSASAGVRWRWRRHGGAGELGESATRVEERRRIEEEDEKLDLNVRLKKA